ncbi:prenyltransferase [Pseudomonas sp. SP16.1]|uniref:prenyltransferase n=1 Tax=Pseudomonas sp. SP16.1 TaxID=3458854 RepID=UPI00404638B3
MSGVTLLRAARPNFLLLALLCVALGLVLSERSLPSVQGGQLLLVVLGAVLAHAAVNLLNEYQDFRSGLDLLTERTPFSGGSGALPDNPGAAPLVLDAALAAMAAVLLIGLYFLWLRGWPMALLGVAGLSLVVGYTRWITRWPWLCLLAPGLGFGPIMILGTQLALGGRPDVATAVVALVVMLLVSELLLINQIPDVGADRRVGRRHLPIVLGVQRASWLVALLLLGAYLLLGGALWLGLLPKAGALAWLALPAALWVCWRLPRVLDRRERLARVLAVNVASLLATLALLALGLWLGD